MNRTSTHRFVPALAALALATIAHAGPLFSIQWHTIDAGGGESSGGAFTVAGTIGQPDAGAMSGGDFSLEGGFWVAPAPAPPACPGDLDGDNDVDSTDLNIVLSTFGCSGGGCAGDLDGDGDTDSTDLNILLSTFGTSCV